MTVDLQKKCIFFLLLKEHLHFWKKLFDDCGPVKKSHLFTLLQNFHRNELIFIPSHTIVAGYYGFTLDIRVSVCPSVICPLSIRLSPFRFQMITWVNINGFSPNLVCALILWRSGVGLLISKFCQFFTELSARDMPIFSFPDDNLSK